MAFKQVIIRRVGPLFWLLGVAETVMSIMSFIKGWFGEAQGAFAQWAFLDQSIYTSLNNITIPTSNGTTQIDHIIVSRHGIFVVEAKNIEGWIFGEKKQKQWVVVRFGRKFRIQNPLHQNYRHTSAIIEFLGIDTAKVQSMVMFWGNCEFKTEMPTNVINSGYIHYIKSFSAVVFTDTEVSCIIRALKVGALPKSWATHEAHLASQAQPLVPSAAARLNFEQLDQILIQAESFTVVPHFQNVGLLGRAKATPNYAIKGTSVHTLDSSEPSSGASVPYFGC
jgi:restriction system protein